MIERTDIGKSARSAAEECVRAAYCRRMPPQTNKEIEDAAVGWVIEIEKQAGRMARDTRYSGNAADISSPPRSIEIKAYGGSD